MVFFNPDMLGGEEIFSTLRVDENIHRERVQRSAGIKSNHAPSSRCLTDNWIDTLTDKVVIVKDKTN